MLALVYGGLLGWVAAQVVVNIPGHLADEVIGRYVQSLGPDTFNQAGNGLYTQYAKLKDGINAFNFTLTAFSARKGENFLYWDVEVDFSSRFDWLITTKEKLNLTGWTAISLNADFPFYSLFNNEEYNCYYGSCTRKVYNLKDTQIQVFSNSSSPQITSRFQEEQESLVDFLIGTVVPGYVQRARDDLVFWGKKTPFGVGEYILDRPREKCMWGVFSVPLRIPHSDWDNYESLAPSRCYTCRDEPVYRAPATKKQPSFEKQSGYYSGNSDGYATEASPAPDTYPYEYDEPVSADTTPPHDYEDPSVHTEPVEDPYYPPPTRDECEPYSWTSSYFSSFPPYPQGISIELDSSALTSWLQSARQIDPIYGVIFPFMLANSSHLSLSYYDQFIPGLANSSDTSQEMHVVCSKVDFHHTCSFNTTGMRQFEAAWSGNCPDEVLISNGDLHLKTPNCFFSSPIIRTFRDSLVVSDFHGLHKALQQLFEMSFEVPSKLDFLPIQIPSTDSIQLQPVAVLSHYSQVQIRLSLLPVPTAS